MISGSLVLEDLTIQFEIINQDGCPSRAHVIVNGDGGSSDYYCDAPAFLAALAIAVHNDGAPNWEEDYPLAESAQPGNPALRFIP